MLTYFWVTELIPVALFIVQVCFLFYVLLFVCSVTPQCLLHFATSLSAKQPVYLIEHVEGQESEAQIVEHQEASAGVRLPVFHVLGPHPHDQKVHDCECKGWWVVVEQ